MTTDALNQADLTPGQNAYALAEAQSYDMGAREAYARILLHVEQTGNRLVASMLQLLPRLDVEQQGMLFGAFLALSDAADRARNSPKDGAVALLELRQLVAQLGSNLQRSVMLSEQIRARETERDLSPEKSSTAK